VGSHDVRLELYYDGDWHQAPVREGDPVTIKRGTTTPAKETDPARASLTIDNNAVVYSPRSVSSALAGKLRQNMPGRVSVDGGSPLVGEATSWVPDRAVKGDAWTAFELSGTLQRLGRGSEPILAALDQSILSNAPAAYWPLNDAKGSTSAASGLVGGAPMTIDSEGTALTVAFGEVEGPISGVPDRFPEFIANGEYTAKLVGAVPQPAAPVNSWQVSFWFRSFTTDTAGQQGFPLDWTIEGSDQNVGGHFWLEGEGRVTVHTWHGDGTFYTIMATALGSAVMDGQWHHTRATFEQVTGSTYTARLYLDGTLMSSAVGLTGTIGYPSQVKATGYAQPFTYTVPDYLNVMGIEVSTTLADHYEAGLGYPGELAADRFERLCGLAGITPTVIGTAADTVPMGAQRPLTLLGELDEIVRTDDAHIFETRDAVNALTMVTGESKQNQDPVLTISYRGHIVPPLKPVIGDTGLRNKVTGVGRDGTTRVAEQTIGPRNTQRPEDDPQGVGEYSTRLEVNPSTPNGVGDAAGWRVNIGTYDGTWYAVITVDLDAAPALAPLVTALEIGQIIGLGDLPVDESLTVVSLVLLGTEDSVRRGRRTFRLFTTPADPYHVGILAETVGDTDPVVGRLESDGATTVGVTAALASSMSVATASGPLWTTDADDFPMEVVAGGQRLTISSITGGSSPQTFNISASGNRNAYSIPADSQVFVRQPLILTL